MSKETSSLKLFKIHLEQQLLGKLQLRFKKAKERMCSLFLCLV